MFLARLFVARLFRARLFLARLVLAAWPLLLCLPALLPAGAGAAQPERWDMLAHTPFKHLTAAEAASTTAMAQDQAGFLWLGTQAGLSRWDGYKLRHYAAGSDNGGALPDSYILSLYVDPRGSLWIGTGAGGLARYDAARDKFVTYPAGRGGVSHASVTALAGDGAGGVWIGTPAGLDHMSADAVLTRAGSGAPAIGAASLPAGGVEALLRDRRGNLWLGTAHGLLRRAHGSAVLQRMALAAPGQPEPSVNALYQDSAGRVWAGTRTRGAMYFAEGASVAVAVRESGAASTIGSERVLSIVEAAPGQIWLGTEGMGILVVNPDGGATRRIRHQPGVPDSLVDNDINALFRERSGLVFAATSGALSQFDPHSRAITTLRQSGTPLGGALSIASILVRPDGRLLLGVPGGGVHVVDPVTGGAGHLVPGGAAGGKGMPGERVLGMANGPGGAVYLGTQHGLYRSGAADARPERVILAPRRADAPAWSLEFHDGAFWLGGIDGLWVYAMQGGVPGKLLRHEAGALGDPGVTALLPGADGAMWIGTRAGLARMHGAGGRLERIATGAGGLPPGYVSALLMDGRARLWVALYGSGVAVLERSGAAGQPVFRRIGAADGLHHQGVNAMQEDRAGAIWVSTDDGLARIDPVSYKVTVLGAGEGVHVRSYWTNSSARTADGELLFGGLTGLTVVQPAHAARRMYEAPLVVTEVSVNDSAVPEAPFNRAAPGAARPAAIEITPEGRPRGFALEMAALDFSAPEKNRYSYRLLGFDAGWISAGAGAAARRISYTNLPPGDYTLQLRGANRDGAWSPALSVPVRVQAAWHQRPWLQILFALALAALLGALFRARTARMWRRQRELEQLVDEGSAALQASQRQLEVFAYADPLTGLPNRRWFNDEMRQLVARALRENGNFTLLLVDLDHFKRVNDTFGHDAGNALLVEAARRLALAVCEPDRVVRLGGDEFAVLLPLTADQAGAGALCARLVAGMAEPALLGERRIQISASVGAAAFCQAGADADALYRAADLALHDIKRRGGNGWSWFDP